ncbi:T9SS type A sorting domain-containing protein [Prolixibacteraceae bacterium Z1-6]|uniref:T9SS type A sorting domain-containing protein n=1 Tax=Draconibacterium aestuarii TaxID=2998507 RepID=A0A9X3J8S4_9BACT|nr:T9SS type A sorting domain-containing protein [Prolixibacteraceae bacterium Z1-6]
MKPLTLLIILLMTLAALGQGNDQKSQNRLEELLVKNKLNHSEYCTAKNKAAVRFTESRNNSYNFSMKSVAEKQNLDSVIVSWMDEETGLLLPFMKSEYTYTASGKTEQEIHFFFDENTEVLLPELKMEYSYDASGNISGIQFFTWAISNQWVVEGKIVNTFNDDDSIAESLFYSWNGNTNSWLQEEKQEFEYDINGKLIRELSYTWNDGSGQFVAEGKEEYAYNSAGSKTQEMSYYWDAGLNQWTNTNKSTYTFNENNERILSEYFSLDESNQLTAIGKTEYTFSNGVVAQSMHYEKDEGSNGWFIVGKYDYTYDEFGNMVQELGYYWDKDANQYVYESKINIAYDHTCLISDLNFPMSILEDDEFFGIANHKVDSIVGLVWIDGIDEWFTFLKSIYYYSESNITDVNNFDKQTVKVYPNPVQDYLYMVMPDNSMSFKFEVFDITGHLLLNKYATSNTPVNMRGISPGMYLYRITTLQNEVVRGKLIKN